MSDENVDPIVKEFANFYGLKILYGQIVRPPWIGDEIWLMILEGIEYKIQARKIKEEIDGSKT